MLAIMKADLQRIFRGKGIYITLTLFVLFTIGQIFGEAVIVSLNIENTEMDRIIEEIAPTGDNMAGRMMKYADNIFYFMLPVLIFVAATDFSSGAVKNVLSSGISRVKYYLTKLILSCIIAVLLYIFYVSVPIITVTIQNGFGGTFDSVVFLRMLKSFLAQLLIILAVTCVGIFLVFTTKKAAAVIGAYLAFLMIFTLPIQMLAIFNERFTNLFAYDLVMNIRVLANITELSTGDTIKYLLVGVGYILVSTIGGMTLFRRSEVK